MFQCYTFVVMSAAGVPLQGVCLAITSSNNPSTVGCPDPHYTTDATGTARVGTLAGNVDVFFLYPGKQTVGPIHVVATSTTNITIP